MIESKTYQYAVMGHPITHSKSPQIHNLFAEQCNTELHYTKLDVPAEDFRQALDKFIQDKGQGLNITAPLKNLAWQSMDKLDAYAKQAQAVNTITIDSSGQCTGYNTDGIGLLNDLQNNHNIELNGKRILVLGAGGAVQGVLQALLEKSPEQLIVANRTLQKALNLCQQFTGLGNIQGTSLIKLEDKSFSAFDIIINGTSMGLNNQTPKLASGILKPNGITYDMMYADTATAFVRWGQQQNSSKSLDGLGMLIEQAAQSFFIWTQQRPQTQKVIQALRPTT